MGDKWTTSGRSRLKAKQNRTFGARHTQTKNITKPSTNIFPTRTNNNQKIDNNNVPIHPILRKRNGGIQGSYSAYADPLARRAIADSNTLPSENENNPNHPIHPSRLQNNIRRRIRDPNQRQEIIAHYNTNHRDTLPYQPPPPIMYPRQYHGNVMTTGIPPFHDNYQSPNNVQMFTHPVSTQPFREQLTQATPVYATHQFPGQYINPLQQFQYQDKNMYSHSDQDMFAVPQQSVLQINHNTGQTNGWYNNPNSCGIPQFQQKRNILLDPPITTFRNNFVGPPRPASAVNFVEHPSSPTTTSPIFPHDTLIISPSEQINSMSYAETIPDQMHYDNDLFHESINLENETNCTSIDVNYGHNDMNASNVPRRDQSVVSYPQTYMDENIGCPTMMEGFDVRPMTIHQPFMHSDNQSSSYHYSEQQNQRPPPFQKNFNVPQNNYHHHENHQNIEQTQGIPQFQKDRPVKNTIHLNEPQENGIPQFQERANYFRTATNPITEIVHNNNDLSIRDKSMFSHSATNDNIHAKRSVNPYTKHYSSNHNITPSIVLTNHGDVREQADIDDTKDSFDDFQMDDNISLPKGTNTISNDVSRGNQPLFTQASISYDTKTKFVNPYTQRVLSSKNISTNIEMKHCDDARQLDVHDTKDSTFKLQPRNTLRDTIRFFNEGIEVDINNHPLQRPHSCSDSINMITQRSNANEKKGLTENQFDDLNDDDFNLMGKTSIWDTMK